MMKVMLGARHCTQLIGLAACVEVLRQGVQVSELPVSQVTFICECKN